MSGNKKAERDAARFKDIAQNRRARANYAITETLEAGLVLTGSEVKSCRLGGASLNEAFATTQRGQLVLMNSYIAEYKQAGSHLQHEPRRPRVLLLHKRQRDKLQGAIKRDGMTVVPLKMYFNARGLVKVELGLAKGKNVVDKRADIKARDWQRDKARLMKKKG